MTVVVSSHFADPAHQCQQVFRGLLKAMSRPGHAIALPAPSNPLAPFGGALAAAALTLFDLDSPVWLDAAFDVEPVRQYLHLHTGAPLVGVPGAATFALIGAADRMPRLEAFASGEAAYPDRSTTLFVKVPALTGGTAVSLRGPGIEYMASVSPAGLPGWFWPAWNDNAERYPLGVDVFIADEHALIGLPRTARVMI
jgi:alpha-D-ribose 1-methylphosphonate 5-triphosphate synthase subunit PhnH